MNRKYWVVASTIPILIAASVACQWVGIRTYRIPTSSMEPAIKKGQLVFVRTIKNASGRDFKRGDLVVVRSPEDQDSVYARRVVGIPGDAIQVHPDMLLINGSPASEPYATWTEKALVEFEPDYKVRLRERFEVGPVSISPDTVYVLCDNRLDTPDSRKWGPVGAGNVVGFVLGKK